MHVAGGRAIRDYFLSGATCYTGRRWLRMRRDDATQPSAAEFVARLKASREALMDAIAGLDEEGFRTRPDASAWSIAEVLAHLFATERILVERARAALTQEGFIATPRTEAARQEDARLAQRLPVLQILHALLAQRRDTIRLLEGRSAPELAQSFHPQQGERTVGWLFQRAAEHEDEHAQQVRALRGSVPAEAP